MNRPSTRSNNQKRPTPNNAASKEKTENDTEKPRDVIPISNQNLATSTNALMLEKSSTSTNRTSDGSQNLSTSTNALAWEKSKTDIQKTSEAKPGGNEKNVAFTKESTSNKPGSGKAKPSGAKPANDEDSEPAASKPAKKKPPSAKGKSRKAQNSSSNESAMSVESSESEETIKHRDFTTTPMKKKLVCNIPGIGDAGRDILKDHGYFEARQVYGRYLVLRGSQRKFVNWLVSFNIQHRYAEIAFEAMDDFYNHFNRD